MNLFTAFIAWIFDPQPLSKEPQERDERYLAAAVDMADLERRMRLLDERRPTGPFGQGA
jgi:hypothetical protein